MLVYLFQYLLLFGDLESQRNNLHVQVQYLLSSNTRHFLHYSANIPSYDLLFSVFHFPSLA